MDEQQVAMLVQALRQRQSQQPMPQSPPLPPAPAVTSTDPMPQLNTQPMMPPAQQPYYPSQIPGLPPPEPSVQGNVSPQDRMAIMGMQGDDLRKWMNRPENLIRALMGGL